MGAVTRGRWRVPAACAALIALTSCAYLTGPCTIDVVAHTVVCLPGGTALLLGPARLVDAVEQAASGPHSPPAARTHPREPGR